MRILGGEARGLGPIAVTLGSFDGVHLGHLSLLARLARMARDRGAQTLVITFDPHPREVLSPGTAPPLLTTLVEREALLAQAGVDLLVRVRFDRTVAALSAERFLLERVLPMGEVAGFVVGYDFHFGKGRQGDVALLEAVGRREGFAVERHEPQARDGVLVKSTAIRDAVRAGDVAAAARLLGRHYAVRGSVVHGSGRGHSLGFSTANVAIDDPRKLLPADGVYAVRVTGERLAAGALGAGGVANLGNRPTFGGGARTLEAHLFAENLDLYGSEIAVGFVARLREERAFPTPQALVAQIARDVEQAREALQSAAGAADA